MNREFKAAGLEVFERGWLSSNNVLFKGGASSETVLVDSGYFSHGAQTVSLVGHALGGRRLDRIVNTHLHSDHCGGNSALQLAFGSSIDVPEAEAGAVDAWDQNALSFLATGQQCPKFDRTGVVVPGTVVQLGSFRWEVIPAPGHDARSIVLYQPEHELLISADALWENGFGVVFPEVEGLDAFDQVRHTLNAIRRLRVKWVIPGHGAPFGSMEAAVDRAERRLKKFIADPRMHARHTAKVLIKFHMLEVLSARPEVLDLWCMSTGYLRLAHVSYFPSEEFLTWISSVVQELVAGGALAREDEVIVNC